jgi:predicted Na+-dependent transporter
MFNADLALSVTMTAISTILSIVALPMNLLIYANATYDSEIIENLDWGAVFLALGIVIAAIALGLYASYWNHSYRFNMIANQVGNVSGLALIIFSATAANTGEDADAKIWSRSWDFYIGVGLPCILGLLIGTGLTTFLDLAPPERM